MYMNLSTLLGLKNPERSFPAFFHNRVPLSYKIFSYKKYLFESDFNLYQYSYLCRLKLAKIIALIVALTIPIVFSKMKINSV